MKIATYVVGVLLATGLIMQLVNFYSRNAEVATELQNLMAQISSITDENLELEDDIKYFSNQENLAKELKARFDYKRPGETLIKVQ